MEISLDQLAGREFRMSSFEFRRTDPNKPNGPKTLVFNSMIQKSAKQTQRTYHTCYQLLTAILAPISGKFGSKGPGSLLGIRATARGSALQTNGVRPRRDRRRREEFTSKPTMCLRMSISEDIRPIRNSETIKKAIVVSVFENKAEEGVDSACLGDRGAWPQQEKWTPAKRVCG